MAERPQPPPGCKRMSLDKIIESMTADLENSAGQYVQFGVTPPQATSHGWGDYPSGQPRHYLTTQPPASPQTINPLPSPIYAMPEIPAFEPPAPDPIFFPPQPVNHLVINENNDLVGTIDVGGGNYINVIYGSASQIMPEQCQLGSLASYNTQTALDREYGLFGDQRPMIPQNLTPQTSNGKQLIDNLVGNWVPNQSGTYSPFGGSPNVTPVPQGTPEIREPDELPRNMQDSHHKKPRMIAEVRPMRPSYSDVLTKSAPTPPPPLTPPANKPKIETAAKKNSGKSNKKTKPAVLKRQNSSGSEDHSSPKIVVPKKVFEKNNSNLPRRWVSLDNLGSATETHDVNDFDRSDNFEKKRNGTKAIKKGDKNETLNNSKIQNSGAKCATTIQKRPIQINNNLNTINSSSQTVSPDKIEKNQQANNKASSKDDKKLTKEKTVKRSQAEKAQQIKKGHRNRKRESRESPVKDLCRNLNKHVTRWSKIALKIFYWLFHLISDVVSMSANLVAQL